MKLFSEKKDFENNKLSYYAFIFAATSVFNQNVSSFDTSAVTDMREVFDGAASFNQDISGWSTSAQNLAKCQGDERGDAGREVC